ncbi:hypothetical protein KBZ18_07760 [Synechococcus sp. Cruz-9H2]|uniref:hypothetical protein n=1 Tax=unclassified Synechococcus TaxID=2626047 RepID=UPI0020CFCBB4|nr:MULTISPECIES: hypothetical protein [unclassified Synechococcus]MCP9819387.1 hypothetical protein [Synechococcus sp. Cruz-9H2]MCP9843180.1 hypothetical protein [Synechococcus sp. Edmonson 11F2]MCP9854925.1 hypothetical protein [Synechococcus sp. Cruz-9C9]MCP9862604.1 hypothetical protein [Synechococcus sp. Cruz-7E5]MCP9870297.1 hypothetical protein [Synechococcus sp. Cruz-7B9]
MTEDQKDVLLSLLSALKRAQRKSRSLIVNPELLDQEEGEDALDVICMQFLAAGESLKRLERLYPDLLQNRYPHIDWEGAMGFPMSSLTSILILMLNKFLSSVNSRCPA